MPITALPALNRLGASFKTDVDTFFGTQMPTFCTEANALQVDVNAALVLAQAQVPLATAQTALATTQATNAANSANSAAAGAATAGAIAWVSGTTYAIGNARFSPADSQTYRRITSGAGTTDPSADPTNWTRVVLGAGTGGAVPATGSVVLTNTSGAAQTLTALSYGRTVTLPNATTCTLGGYFFNLYNNSQYAFRVLDFAGATQGFIAPYSGAVLSLSSTASAAGLWNFTELQPYAVTAQAMYNNTGFTINSNSLQRVVIDGNRTLLLFAASTTAIYGVVFDASTQAWGALTLIRSSAANFAGILSTTNQVLVCSCNATTGMEAVTLTLSGTTITVNTAATATLVASIVGGLELIAVGTSWVVGCNLSASPVSLRALTISGTTVTIGTAVTVSGVSTPHFYAVSSSVLLAITAQASASMYATPYTVSGSTLTLGTGTTMATDSANAVNFRSFVLGTRWGVIFNGTGGFISASIVSVASTTATASTLQNCLSSNTDTVSTTTDFCVSGSKFALVCGSAALGFCANIITDTAGTASKGTALAYAGYAFSTNTTAHVRLSGSSASFVASTTAQTLCYTFDISGASPTLQSSQVIKGATGSVARPANSSVRNLRSGTWFKGAAVSYAIGTDSTLALAIGPNLLERFQVPSQTLDPANAISGADNEVWAYNITGTGYPAIQRLECVA